MSVTRGSVLVGVVVASSMVGIASGQMRFEDVTEDVGLDAIEATRVCFADLNRDGWADAVVDRHRVFLHAPDASSPLGWRFEEVESPGLVQPEARDLCVFADVDNDGIADAVFTRYHDGQPAQDRDRFEPSGSVWLAGNGDGTFGDPVGSWSEIPAATPASTAAIAAGDVDRDGWLDLWIGNWYTRYGQSLAGHANELLVRAADAPVDEPGWARVALDQDVQPEPIQGENGEDPGGRPTYGVLIAELIDGNDGPELLELNYGRRWNRVLVLRDGAWHDVAHEIGLDGDGIRHGRYPAWLKERARQDARFEREDELPFRANGNTFDAAVGDVDNDGDLDVFLAEITHGWAGESSDRSRLLVQRERQSQGDGEGIALVADGRVSVDRVPDDPTIRSWNQGDLYAELADLDHDGRLDLIVCSSDYPDDQRLRVWRQQADGSFADVTPWIGIDHIGAQQLSLADLDHDGDLDLIVGQSFTRLSRSQRAGRTPRLRVFLNKTAERSLGRSLVLRLEGDPSLGCATDALGALVRVEAQIGGKRVVQTRQLIGIGGHQGKQHEFLVHVGLREAPRADRVEIVWPTSRPDTNRTVIDGLDAGSHTIRQGDR